MSSLQSLAETALENAGLLTFSIENVKAKASTTGKVGYKAVCDDETVITFWSSNIDSVVDEIAEGKFRVKPGVQVAKDGGLIPADKQSKGFWS